MVACLPLLAIACSSDGGQDDSGSHRGARGSLTRDSSAGIIAPATPAYRVEPVASPATLSGTVVIDGGAPGDSAVAVPAAQQTACGASLPDPTLQHKGSGLGNAVVWIAGLRTGKPFPVDRRFELNTVRCDYDPHVQAVVTGSTVNVHNDDDAPETTHMVRLGSTDTMASVSLIDDGGVVPTDQIARSPGIVQFRSAQHPWARGYVAVFDQPYFAVTAPDGSFRIDSLPPGRYKLMVWQERMPAPMSQDVDVVAGKPTSVTVRVKLR